MVKSAVRVIVRTRPTDKFAHQCIKLGDDSKTVNVHMPSKKKKDDFVNNQQEAFSFKFDSLLHNASQEAVYAQAGQDVVRVVLEGFNGTILAYGQTGAGKTFTMSGGNDFKQRGVIPRAIAQIFNDITNKPEQSFQIRCSYVEIYNDQIYDLLAEGSSGNMDSIHIQEDAKGGVTLKGAVQQVATQESDALGILFQGSQNRAVAEHKLNSNSTRSHCLFTIYVSSRSRVESEGHTTHSKLHCVDLAGSERPSKSGTEGQTLKEAMAINKSLSFLEQVVIALGTGGREHVPFRQCKLTNVLKDSLGGNCKTTMIANVWAEEPQLDETVGTLKFATRMMRVQNDASVNMAIDPQAQIRRMAKEIQELKSELQMQNQLHGKSHITYGDDFTDDERFELQKQVQEYLQGKVAEIEVKSIRQVKEYFRIFKVTMENNEAEVKSRLAAMDASGTRDDGAAGSKPSTGKLDDTGDGFVGDVDGDGGFGVGTAVAAKMDKSVKETVRTNGQPPASSPSAAAHTPAPPTSNVLNVEMPDRNQAFDDYKTGDGLELANTLKTAQHALREKRRLFKELSVQVNDLKEHVEFYKSQADLKKRERESLGEDDDVVDEEEFKALRSLKESRQKYRQVYDQMQAAKAEREHESRLTEQARLKLISEFEQWYESTYGVGTGSTMPPIGQGSSAPAPGGRRGRPTAAGDDDEVLDEGERFENLELERIMAEDPDSAAYYSAKKHATGRSKPGAAARNQRKR